MGYDTYTTIEIAEIKVDEYRNRTQVNPKRLKEVYDYLSSNFADMFCGVAMEDTGYIDLGYCRWYSRYDDMYRISSDFPELEFLIYGDGDDTNDVWYEYWMNGACDWIIPEWRAHNPRRFQKYNPAKESLENNLPEAYNDSGKSDRRVADRLFELSDAEVLDLGNKILNLYMLNNPDPKSLLEKVRIAYDADSAKAMFAALTGAKLESLIPDATSISNEVFDEVF